MNKKIKSFLINSLQVILFALISLFSIPLSMIIGLIIKKLVCIILLNSWNYCHYVDPIGDIPEKDLFYFIFPSRIFIITISIYLLYKLHKYGRKDDNNKTKGILEKDYYLIFLIIIGLIPILLLFLGNIF